MNKTQTILYLIQLYNIVVKSRKLHIGIYKKI
nr:MAG TPA: hypothetical protein [Caudoviricetes sp.]